MRGDEHPKRALLRSGRAQTIERLSNAFARDELGLDEFEERLNRAYAAEEVPALDALVQDLSPEAVALQAEVVAPERGARACRAVGNEAACACHLG